MFTRRRFLETAGAGLAVAGGCVGASTQFAAAGAGFPLPPGMPAGVDLEAALETLPGKQPLIRLSYRPPNYESPLDYFSTPITPNERFYVRYHLADIPEIDAKTYRLAIGGDGDLMFAPTMFWTAAHHKIPLLYVLHNNRAYHQEIMWVQTVANRRQRGVDRVHIGTTIDNPYIDYATNFGARSNMSIDLLRRYSAEAGLDVPFARPMVGWDKPGAREPLDFLCVVAKGTKPGATPPTAR